MYLLFTIVMYRNLTLTVMSRVVETSVNGSVQFKSGPPQLAEQEHRDMLRPLAVAQTALFRPTLVRADNKKKKKQ